MRITPEDMAQMEGQRLEAPSAMAGTLIITAILWISVPLGLIDSDLPCRMRRKTCRRRHSNGRCDDRYSVIVAGLFAYALFELFLGPGTWLWPLGRGCLVAAHDAGGRAFI